MARLPRFVIPGQPQHVIQRGNNRQAIFRAEADYQFFLEKLAESRKQTSVRYSCLRTDDEPCAFAEIKGHPQQEIKGSDSLIFI